MAGHATNIIKGAATPTYFVMLTKVTGIGTGQVRENIHSSEAYPSFLSIGLHLIYNPCCS